MKAKLLALAVLSTAAVSAFGAETVYYPATTGTVAPMVYGTNTTTVVAPTASAGAGTPVVLVQGRTVTIPAGGLQNGGTVLAANSAGAPILVTMRPGESGPGSADKVRGFEGIGPSASTWDIGTSSAGG